jgi:hypothetical protein
MADIGGGPSTGKDTKVANLAAFPAPLAIAGMPWCLPGTK